MRISKKLKSALKRYYDNWKAQAVKRWDKQADIENIIKNLGKNIIRYQIMAGTFWFIWKNGKQTTHNHKNYWCCKKLVDKPKE